MAERNLAGRLKPALLNCLLGAALCLAGCASSRTHRAPSGKGALNETPDRRFSWPISGGVLSSGFGMRDGVMHDGIDIAAPTGTPVRAADRGETIFAGRLRGYGNVVILRHSNRYVTIYAHNHVNLVHEGDFVARGQVVAEVGSSGRTTGPNLHFEVRRDNFARDPINYLPLAPAGGQSFARRGTP